MLNRFVDGNGVKGATDALNFPENNWGCLRIAGGAELC